MVFPFFGHPVLIMNMLFFSLCLVANSYLQVSVFALWNDIRRLMFS